MVTMATVLIMQFVVLSQAWQIKRHGCHSNPLGHIAASILFFVPEGAAKRLWATGGYHGNTLGDVGNRLPG